MTDGPQRWLGPLLLASLATNLFLVGLISPQILNRSGGDAPRAAARDSAESRITYPISAPSLAAERAVSGDARRALVGAMAPRREALDAAMRDVGETRRQVARALATEPYNSDAFASATEAFNRAILAAQVISRQIVAEAARDLPPEDRLTLVSLSVTPSALVRLAQAPRGFMGFPPKP